MNWAKFFLHFLRTVVIWCGIAALGLGLAGYLLAGSEGAKNGATWGLILGFTGGLISIGPLVFAFFWGGVAGRAGAEWLKDETQGKKPDDRAR